MAQHVSVKEKTVLDLPWVVAKEPISFEELIKTPVTELRWPDRTEQEYRQLAHGSWEIGHDVVEGVIFGLDPAVPERSRQTHEALCSPSRESLIMFATRRREPAETPELVWSPELPEED